MPTINKTFVDTAPAGEHRDGKLSGFVLDVGKSGVKTYKVHSRIKGGKLITYTIGPHGDPWTATTAYKEADRILHMMKTGIDPRAALKKQRAEDQSVLAKDAAAELRKDLTLRRVFEDWYVEARNKQSAKKLDRILIFKHLKDWLDVPMADIDEDMVCKRYEYVATKLPTASSANNVFRSLRRLYNYAINKYKIDKKPVLEENPVMALGKRKRDKWIKIEASEEYIPDTDLKAWYEAVQSLENEDFKDYFVLLLFTGLRKAEALGMRWSTKGKPDIDFKQGRLTVHETKNKTKHTLPMTPYIEDLLRRREKKYKTSSDFVFPGKGSKTGHRADVRLPQKQITDKSGVIFTPHALRRTFAYAAERAGIGVTQQKKLLNHLDSRNVTFTNYSPKNVADLLEPLQKVEDYLRDLALNGKQKSPATKKKASKNEASSRKIKVL
jgi:integrase